MHATESLRDDKPFARIAAIPDLYRQLLDSLYVSYVNEGKGTSSIKGQHAGPFLY
jgi:hypothetical protein